MIRRMFINIKENKNDVQVKVYIIIVFIFTQMTRLGAGR